MKKILMTALVFVLVVPIAFLMTGCFDFGGRNNTTNNNQNPGGGGGTLAQGTYVMTSFTWHADPTGYVFPRNLSEVSTLTGVPLNWFEIEVGPTQATLVFVGTHMFNPGQVAQANNAGVRSVVNGRLRIGGNDWRTFFFPQETGSHVLVGNNTLTIVFHLNGIHVYTAVYTLQS